MVVEFLSEAYWCPIFGLIVYPCPSLLHVKACAIKCIDVET